MFAVFLCCLFPSSADFSYVYIRLLELVPQLADVLVFCSAFFPLCFILDTFCCYIFKFTNLLSCDICGCCLVPKLCLTPVTPGTVGCQAPLSMGFPRQEYWSGLPFPSLGVFLNQGSNLCLLHWQVDSLPLNLGCLLLIPSSVFFIFRDGLESFLFHPRLYTVAQSLLIFLTHGVWL